MTRTLPDLRTGEVAESLGISRGTVRRAAKAGSLRCWKTPGGDLRFRLVDVTEFSNEYLGQRRELRSEVPANS